MAFLLLFLLFAAGMLVYVYNGANPHLLKLLMTLAIIAGVAFALLNIRHSEKEKNREEKEKQQNF